GSAYQSQMMEMILSTMRLMMRLSPSDTTEPAAPTESTPPAIAERVRMRCTMEAVTPPRASCPASATVCSDEAFIASWIAALNRVDTVAAERVGTEDAPANVSR